MAALSPLDKTAASFGLLRIWIDLLLGSKQTRRH